LKREVEINKILVHPNVVEVHAIYVTSEDYCLVMEYMAGGDLFSKIIRANRSYPMGEDEAKRVTLMILSAVEYLHHLQIAHRYLKPENIVFDTTGPDSTAKLIDFGFAKKQNMNQDSILQTPVGTVEYCAPEVSAQDTYSLAVDMWSLGCVVFFMLCAASPFHASTQDEVDRLASGASFAFPSHIPLSQEVQDFISNLLQLDAEDRMTAGEARSHRWFNPAHHNLVVIEQGVQQSGRVKEELGLGGGPLDDEQQLMLRATINKMIDIKRENPAESKKLGKIRQLVNARESALWQRRRKFGV